LPEESDLSIERQKKFIKLNKKVIPERKALDISVDEISVATKREDMKESDKIEVKPIESKIIKIRKKEMTSDKDETEDKTRQTIAIMQTKRIEETVKTVEDFEREIKIETIVKDIKEEEIKLKETEEEFIPKVEPIIEEHIETQIIWTTTIIPKEEIEAQIEDEKGIKNQ